MLIIFRNKTIGNYHISLAHKWYLCTSWGKNDSLVNQLKTKGILNKVIFIIAKVLGKPCSPGNVPCMLTCSRANVPSVLTCSRANVPCVLTCPRANVPCVLTCSRAKRALRAYVQRTLRAYLSTCFACFACLSAQMPTCLCAYVLTCLEFLVSPASIPCLISK